MSGTLIREPVAARDATVQRFSLPGAAAVIVIFSLVGVIVTLGLMSAVGALTGAERARPQPLEEQTVTAPAGLGSAAAFPRFEVASPRGDGRQADDDRGSGLPLQPPPVPVPVPGTQHDPPPPIQGGSEQRGGSGAERLPPQTGEQDWSDPAHD